MLPSQQPIAIRGIPAERKSALKPLGHGARSGCLPFPSAMVEKEETFGAMMEKVNE